jgi:hypothetical protein
MWRVARRSENGVVVDLSLLRQVNVDPAAKRAWVAAARYGATSIAKHSSTALATNGRRGVDHRRGRDSRSAAASDG